MITYPFPPNASAGAVRSERFARYLSEMGWQIEVITIKPRSDLFEDKDRVHNFSENVTIHATNTFDPWLMFRDKRPKNIFIRAIRSLLMRIFSFPDHMTAWIPFAVKAGLKICKNKSIDAIYTTSPPHSSHLAGLILSRMKKIPWVADFRDPWTLNAYRWNSVIDNLLTKIERLAEKTVYVNSSAILANTKANRKNMLKAFPFIKKDKVIHLPNGWEEFTENDIYDAKKNERLAIVHAGTFYPKFKPYALFYALSAWKKGKISSDVSFNISDIKVILIGSNDTETKNIIRVLDIEDIVEIHPWVAQVDAHRLMCRADMLLATLGTGKESSTYIPSKLFEYIAARKPIIGFFPEGAAAEFIRETNTGTLFTDDTPEPIVEFLNQMIQQKKKGQIIYSPNMSAVDGYHIKSIVNKLATTIDALL